MEHVYRTNEFLNQLQQEVQPKENLGNCTLEKMEIIREEKEAQLRKLFRLEEMKEKFGGEIACKEEEQFEALGETVVRNTFYGIKGLPLLLYKIQPKNSNGKAILYLHGHDAQGIYGAFTTKENGGEHYHKNIAMKMAGLGYTVYLPELFGYGEASYTYELKGEEAQNGCFLNAGYLALCGYNIAGFRIFQSLQVLEWMEQEGFMEPFLFGVSGGSLIGMYVAILDKRIKKIMLSSFVNTVSHSILAKEQCVDNYIPGILQVGDVHELLSLVAPRPLLAANGIWDRPFPVAGTEIAFDFLRKVYGRMGAENQFTGVIFEGRHEVHTETILTWLKEQE